MRTRRTLHGGNDEQPNAATISTREAIQIADSVRDREVSEDRKPWRWAGGLFVVWLLWAAAYALQFQVPVKVPTLSMVGVFTSMLVGAVLLAWLTYLKGKETSRFYMHQRITNEIQDLERNAGSK